MSLAERLGKPSEKYVLGDAARGANRRIRGRSRVTKTRFRFPPKVRFRKLYPAGSRLQRTPAIRPCCRKAQVRRSCATCSPHTALVRHLHPLLGSRGSILPRPGDRLRFHQTQIQRVRLLGHCIGSFRDGRVMVQRPSDRPLKGRAFARLRALSSFPFPQNPEASSRSPHPTIRSKRSLGRESPPIRGRGSRGVGREIVIKNRG